MRDECEVERVVGCQEGLASWCRWEKRRAAAGLVRA